MKISPRAGQLANNSDLVDVTTLISAYYLDRPDSHIPEQRVAFGTSGHRGSSFDRSFNEWHIFAITQPTCSPSRLNGPLHRRLRRRCYLHRRFDCYRAERTSSRVGLSPTGKHRLSRRTRLRGVILRVARNLRSISALACYRQVAFCIIWLNVGTAVGQDVGAA
jgi:hypothetical protein